MVTGAQIGHIPTLLGKTCWLIVLGIKTLAWTVSDVLTEVCNPFSNTERGHPWEFVILWIMEMFDFGQDLHLSLCSLTDARDLPDVDCTLYHHPLQPEVAKSQYNFCLFWIAHLFWLLLQFFFCYYLEEFEGDVFCSIILSCNLMICIR